MLTTIWVQFVGEPKLFQPHVVKQRDHKAIAILGLIIGGQSLQPLTLGVLLTWIPVFTGIAGRALVNVIGAPWTLGLGAGIRILIGFSWLAIPDAKPKSK